MRREKGPIVDFLRNTENRDIRVWNHITVHVSSGETFRIRLFHLVPDSQWIWYYLIFLSTLKTLVRKIPCPPPSRSCLRPSSSVFPKVPCLTPVFLPFCLPSKFFLAIYVFSKGRTVAMTVRVDPRHQSSVEPVEVRKPSRTTEDKPEKGMGDPSCLFYCLFSFTGKTSSSPGVRVPGEGVGEEGETKRTSFKIPRDLP